MNESSELESFDTIFSLTLNAVLLLTFFLFLETTLVHPSSSEPKALSDFSFEPNSKRIIVIVY